MAQEMLCWQALNRALDLQMEEDAAAGCGARGLDTTRSLPAPRARARR